MWVSTTKKSIFDYVYCEMAQKFIFVLFLASAFTFSVTCGYAWVDSRRYFGLAAIMIVYYLLNPKLKTSPLDFATILLMLVFYLIAAFTIMNDPYFATLYNPIPYAWMVPCVYLLGKLIVGTEKKDIDKRVVILLTVIAVGMMIQSLLNYSTYFRFYFPERCDVWVNFWDHELDASRNVYNYGFYFTLGALFFAFLNRKQNKKYFIGVLIANVIAIVCNLLNGGRTITLMVFMTNFVMFVLYFLVGRYEKTPNKKRFAIRTAIVTTSFFGVLLVLFLYIEDILLKLFPNVYILNRNGGVFHNIRFELWKAGLKGIFSHQKGGWLVHLEGDSHTLSHNSWLEYGRYYDIIVFFILAIFLMVVLVQSIRFLFKYSKKHVSIYFPVSILVTLFIYSMMEPDYYAYKDLFLYFFFVVGLISGIAHTESQGDYALLNIEYEYSPNKYRYTLIGLASIALALFHVAYRDWWGDKLFLGRDFIMPTVAFLIGGMLFKRTHRKIAALASVAISSILAAYIYFTSISTYKEYGYFQELVTEQWLEGPSLYFGLIILPVALLIALLCWKLKLNKAITAIVITIVSFVGYIPFIRDGRLVVMKEALRLQVRKPHGMPWSTSRENVMEITTSHNTWLDFARNYGVLTLGLFMVLEVVTIYCLIKMIRNNHKDITEYILIVAFILFNVQFMFETSAVLAKYLFALALFVYGMICSSLTGEEESLTVNIYVKEDSTYMS